MMITLGDMSRCGKAFVAAACVLALQGCRGDHSHQGGEGEEEEHHGHVIPAHKPRTFPDAVRRLRELNAKIESSVSAGSASDQHDDQALEFALDIATWLPEIAADSDMPEEPWNKVNAVATVIVTDYRRLSEGAAERERAVDAAALLKDAGRGLSELETVLAGANPKWFGVKKAASAAVEPGSSK
jgi:hypothetical protein